MTEDEVQGHVVKFLEAYGRPDMVWFAVPNGEKRSLMTGAKLKLLGVRRGAPDIVILMDGVFHGFEIKTEEGRLSTIQELFGSCIELAGGAYHVVYGLDDAVATLIRMCAFKPGVKFTFPNSLPPGRRQDNLKHSRSRKR